MITQETFDLLRSSVEDACHKEELAALDQLWAERTSQPTIRETLMEWFCTLSDELLAEFVSHLDKETTADLYKALVRNADR